MFDVGDTLKVFLKDAFLLFEGVLLFSTLRSSLSS